MVASLVTISDRASTFSVTTARRKVATMARAARSGSGGLSATIPVPLSAASAAAGSSGLGSTTTPSGRRGSWGSSASVVKLGPRGALALQAAAKMASGQKSALFDGRIIRAGDRDHRMRRRHRPSARLFVEIGGDEAKSTGRHVRDADPAQRVVAEQPLEIGAPFDDTVGH